ncbi:MAG: MATE family efflux transporter [Lachnospiraceae bacterium]|nr:MATE family efflux transporter [Lachnospiraceae bacterium]
MEIDMTKGKPAGLIARFIIPIIIGNIFQQLYSMADTIIVGRFVGVEALAAVGSTGAVTFLILGFTQGLTTGFTVLTAQRFGAGDREGMKKSIGSAVILSAFVAVFMTAVSMRSMDWLLTVMNTPEDIFDMAKSYIMIICAGIFSNVLYNLLASIMRAIGNSVVPLVLLLISSVINIVLDYVLIVYGHMGVAGAAYATVISQAAAGLLCLIYMMKCVPVLHVEKHHFALDVQCIRNQLAVGIPMALQFSITAVGTILVQAALNLLGSTVVASYSVSSKVEQLVSQPFCAMGVTMATYCAQNRGVNDLDRIQKGVKIANIMSAIYAVVIYGVIYMVLPHIIGLFVAGDIGEVYGYARTFVIICGAFFIPLGMIFIFRNALQGCGFGFLPMMGGVVELVSRSAMAFVAARLLSYEGVCMANVAAWSSAGIFLWIAYRILMKKMIQSKAAFCGESEHAQIEALHQTRTGRNPV